MSMLHQEALATKASERYLLGEMTEPERFDFEAHYFDCPACADEVRSGAKLARGIHAVCAEDEAVRPIPAIVRDKPRRGWLSWLSPSSLVPSTAAAALGCLAAWQGLVVIPSLQWATNPQALAPVALRAAARGEEQVLDVRRDKPVTALSLDINAAAPGENLKYDLLGPGGVVRYQDAAQVPPAGSSLIVFLPTSAIRESGAWQLVVRGQRETEIARFPFSVQIH